MDVLTADPAEVHAVVVGLEGYPGAELDGPVADALAFAGWLRERGVPPGNITLWLYPRENGRPREAAYRDITVRWAGVGSATALRDSLREPRRGHTLYVYWAGHGVLARSEQRMLMYPGHPDETASWLDTGAFFEALSDRRISDFAQQVFLFDACASYVERQLRQDPAPLPLGHYRRDPGARQFVIHATGPDQRAVEPHGRGVFSVAAVDWLSGQPGLLPDPQALADHVVERLAQEGHRQTPTVHVRNWERKVQVHAPAPAAPAVDPALRERLRKELARCFTGLSPEDVTTLADALGLPRPALTDPVGGLATLLLSHERALPTLLDLLGPGHPKAPQLLRLGPYMECQAVRTLSDAEHQQLTDLARALPEPTAADLARVAPPGHETPAPGPPGPVTPKERLLDLVEHLDRQPLRFPRVAAGPPLLPAVVKLLENLAALPCVGEPLAREIHGLTERVVDRLTISRQVLDNERADAHSRARPTWPPRVAVQLKRIDDDRFHCWISVDRGDGNLTLVSDGPDRPCERHQVVGRILRAIRESGHGSDQLIEVFLDLDDLDLDVPGWHGPPDDVLDTILGTDHRVVIRSTEVAFGEAELRRRWNAGVRAPVRLRDADAPDRGFQDRLTDQSDTSRVTVHAGPDDRLRAVRIAVALGYPIVISDPEAATAVPDTHFDPLEPDGAADDLPERARQCRRARHPAALRPLLIWQNPDLPMPTALSTIRT